MKIHFLFIFLTLIKYVINSKIKSNIGNSGIYLGYIRKDSNLKLIPKKKYSYINNLCFFKRRNSEIYKIFKCNLFISTNYLKKFFIKNSYGKMKIIKFRNFNKLWAKKKGVGSTKNGRDSNPKNLGVKILGNNFAYPGNIIVRQRGRTFKPGYGVKQGRDFTLVATRAGKVNFFKGVVSIIDVNEPKKMTFKDIYQENPTILSLSKMWTST
ncbi:apicoplast ribosomal protein L27 precursor, putative [Plasmodium gallinaceum]|uniref:Apicoplast ribosomal protein L27, putative n=1 Tax=Plasmodium gallinaceum TaxID=5849 RepID=A0A1J1H203_PLAGA|nr:apicoplast ribosomal protein L27 precursor, putative [Plasmodium gallinaceum]CRG97358.1 apicoplast ribosomal protein L27 precursor, putative [Plasmodium gallinaceum]